MDIGLKEIKSWHLKRGFNDIGYHFVIRRDGALEVGRPLKKIGAHVKGENSGSIGICFVGGKKGKGGEADNFTLEQMQVGKMLMQDFKKSFPEATIHGHNEFSSKNCPVFDIEIIKP